MPSRKRSNFDDDITKYKKKYITQLNEKKILCCRRWNIKLKLLKPCKKDLKKFFMKIKFYTRVVWIFFFEKILQFIFLTSNSKGLKNSNLKFSSEQLWILGAENEISNCSCQQKKTTLVINLEKRITLKFSCKDSIKTKVFYESKNL